MKTNQTIRHSLMGIAAMVCMLFISCTGETGTKSDGEAVKPPEQIISEEDAAKLFQGYTDSREACAIAAQDSAAQASFIPARYTEFDFKVIKDYIKYIEQEAKAVDTEIETLRIYYAVYPKDKGDRSNKTTVFLVPAADFNGENKAFQIGMIGERAAADSIPWDFGTGAKKYNYSNTKDQRQQAGFVPIPASSAPVQGNKSLVLNDGSTAPPPWH